MAAHFTSGDWMFLRTFIAPATLLAGIVLLALPDSVSSQESTTGATASYKEPLPEAPAPQLAVAAAEPVANSTSVAESKQQPKGFLGMMSSYRVVNAGETPPPPTPRLAFKIATHGSFGYSSFALTGVTSLLSEGLDTNPQLGKGAVGFGRYYWRGSLDKAQGNYLVIFALPTIFRQDERYFVRGKGSILDRGIYASTRVLITPDYHGRNVFNTSEILGRGISEGISLTYYPSDDRTAGSIACKYAFALGKDAATNLFREFWPDVAAHLLHRH
jgi:hypothetical protein